MGWTLFHIVLGELSSLENSCDIWLVEILKSMNTAKSSSVFWNLKLALELEFHTPKHDWRSWALSLFTREQLALVRVRVRPRCSPSAVFAFTGPTHLRDPYRPWLNTHFDLLITKMPFLFFFIYICSKNRWLYLNPSILDFLLLVEAIDCQRSGLSHWGPSFFFFLIHTFEAARCGLKKPSPLLFFSFFHYKKCIYLENLAFQQLFLNFGGDYL